MIRMYPPVLSEDATLSAVLSGKSIARFGDGEFRIARGGAAISQCADPRLAKELNSILMNEAANLVVGIPNLDNAGPKDHIWKDYRSEKFIRLLNLRSVYGSSFITRPDSAPWISREDYWARVRSLWKGDDVIIVTGEPKDSKKIRSIGRGARSVLWIEAPRRDAFAKVDEIEETIGTPSDRVLLALGATATVLAARLNRKGVHAIDIGHIGMFLEGVNMKINELISEEMLDQNRKLHEGKEGFGGSGWKHKENVLAFMAHIKARDILDYGCGECTLRKALRKDGNLTPVYEYDPAIRKKAMMPFPSDLVVCTDVLEHVEPEKLEAVIKHIHSLAKKGCYLVIATRPANKILPNGKNAHLIIEGPEWWKEKVMAMPWKLHHYQDKNKGDGSPHECRFWLMP